MKDKDIRILSTRSLDETLVNTALQHQIIIDSLSFIKTENITDINVSNEIIDLGFKTITAVFTSTNGAEAVIEILHKNALQPVWNIFCIGSATLSSIKEYFTADSIAGTGKNAVELSEKIISNSEEEVVFFCGNQRRDELPENLRRSKITVKELVVYETNETPVKVDKEYNGILFFSPSAVKSFFSLNSIPADTVLFSIGNTTADTIKKNSGNKIIISDFPSENRLAEIAISYLNKTKSIK